MSERVTICETEAIDKLFLELAQFTTATTPMERDFADLIVALLPFVKEPGESHPTIRLDYKRVMDRVELALAVAKRR